MISSVVLEIAADTFRGICVCALSASVAVDCAADTSNGILAGAVSASVAVDCAADVLSGIWVCAVSASVAVDTAATGSAEIVPSPVATGRSGSMCRVLGAAISLYANFFKFQGKFRLVPTVCFSVALTAPESVRAVEIGTETAIRLSAGCAPKKLAK